MALNIRIDLSSVASKHRSGVAQYTRLLTGGLSEDATISVHGHYFNFLNRQPKPELIKPLDFTEENRLIPLRVYAKAQSFGVAPPFDLFLPKVDLTIFPNFATWSTSRSKLSATVIHDLTYIYFPKVVEKKNLAHLKRAVPRSINKADFIITVSESVKSELINEFNLSPDKCVVTPIPPDESFYQDYSSNEISAVKEKYGIDINKRYIYFIGNFEPRKNLKVLIEAYTLLPQEVKDTYSLILAGGKGWNNKETNDILDQAIKSGNDIKHLGFIDQLDSPILFQAASLFVMPSLYEGFGMPILEAMASGTSVIASDIPVLREVGDNYATYADPKNPQSFATTIISVLTSEKASRAELQKNILRYSWSDNIQKITNKVRSLE